MPEYLFSTQSLRTGGDINHFQVILFRTRQDRRQKPFLILREIAHASRQARYQFLPSPIYHSKQSDLELRVQNASGHQELLPHN